jgi:hypothetical protein
LQTHEVARVLSYVKSLPIAVPNKWHAATERLVRSARLDDAQKPEHNHNHYDGDYETKDTAHIRSFRDLRDDVAHNEIRNA